MSEHQRKPPGAGCSADVFAEVVSLLNRFYLNRTAGEPMNAMPRLVGEQESE